MSSSPDAPSENSFAIPIPFPPELPPDIESDENTGGTRSLVKIYFSTLETAGTYGLEFGSNTKLRDAQNDSIRINTFGLGSINVQ